MALFPIDRIDLILGNNEECEYVQKHELRVTIEENWFISFIHSEYHHHEGQGVTIISEPGPNVGLPLQRSASLNYGPQRIRRIPEGTNAYNSDNIDYNKDIYSSSGIGARTTSSVSTTNSTISAATSTNTTDIDNQIRLIESQFHGNNENNREQSDALQSVANNTVSDAAVAGVPVVNNAGDATAAGRMLQIENASSSKSATAWNFFMILCFTLSNWFVVVSFF